MGRRKRLETGAVVDVPVRDKEGRFHVSMQVLDVISGEGHDVYYSVAVFRRAGLVDSKDLANINEWEVLFVPCFALDLLLRAGEARLIGRAPAITTDQWLPPRLIMNRNMVATAVRRAWKAGDDLDLLF